MEYHVKYETFIDQKILRIKRERHALTTQDRNEAISEMRDLVFFHDAQTAWIEVDGKTIDSFHHTEEIALAEKAARLAESA